MKHTKISPHFTLEEFACNDGASYPEEWIDSRLIPLCKNLEVIREAVGKPMIITSAYRTPSWNSKQGGAKKSQHLGGRAVDFYCKDVKPSQIVRILKKLMDEGKITIGGIGLYNGFVHYDIRGSRVFWTSKRKRGQV